jgi:peptidoglycan/xylan/chitin deacetylase (PgdA/CDA1 family)
VKYIYKLQRFLACLIIRRKKPFTLQEPIVTFTFDDAPNSAFKNGAEILKKYGFRGTYFVSLGLADSNRPDGPYFDVSNLSGVVKDGGELGCHTYDHIHLYKSGVSTIKNDLKKNQERIDQLIPGYRFSSFAYPYGEQTITSKRIILEEYKCARSIHPGINLRYADLNNLKAQELKDDIKLTLIYSVIEETIRSKGWLVFYTHDIENNPSNWGCSPEYFEMIVKHCADRKLKGYTIEKVMKMFPGN